MLSQGQWHTFAVIILISEALFHTPATESLEVSLALWTREMEAIKWYTQSQATCFGTAVLGGARLWFTVVRFLLFQWVTPSFCKHNLSPTPARVPCNYFFPFFQICYPC